MNQRKFNDIVIARQEMCRILLGQKATEYAHDGDRLSNFKKAAAMQGIEPEQALLGMLVKHWVSVSEMIGDIPLQEWPVDKWAEKINDSINYLHLLEALLIERYRWNDAGEL